MGTVKKPPCMLHILEGRWWSTLAAGGLQDGLPQRNLEIVGATVCKIGLNLGVSTRKVQGYVKKHIKT